MIHGWWHKFVRKGTKPIPADKAFIWKRRLSVAYGLLAWNAFGFVAYMIYTGKSDWAHYYGFKTDEEKNMPPALSFAKTLGFDNAKVYRVSGFKKVDEYSIVDGNIVRDSQENQKLDTKSDVALQQ